MASWKGFQNVTEANPVPSRGEAQTSCLSQDNSTDHAWEAAAGGAQEPQVLWSVGAASASGGNLRRFFRGSGLQNTQQCFLGEVWLRGTGNKDLRKFPQGYWPRNLSRSVKQWQVERKVCKTWLPSPPPHKSGSTASGGEEMDPPPASGGADWRSWVPSFSEMIHDAYGWCRS